MKSLQELYVSGNKLVGQLPLCLTGLTGLRVLDLSSNNLTGKLPPSLGNLGSLTYLSLLENNFEGAFSVGWLANLSQLRVFRLGSRSKSFQVESEGGEVLPESANFTGIWELSMDNNLFTGKIGQGLLNLRGLQLLDISNNNLIGVIPSWIGELQALNALLLSNNSLEGEIPIPFLQLVDISANTLSGDIPPHVNSLGKALLLFQDNNLSGVIPETLLTHVAVLDLRNNRLSGNVPEFTYTKDTHTLLLRGNNLTGSIPRQLCGLQGIKLLDLSNNRLNGSIPSCFSNTSFAFGKEDTLSDQHYGGVSGGVIQLYEQEYSMLFKSLIVLDSFRIVYVPDTQIKVEFATKHRYDTYLGRNLKLLYGMDLSENELSGDIPADLGGLLELQALNLSHNKLSGSIPENFSGLKNVESLDLSFNRLQGWIPSQLTELSSLAVFNVSFNNLSGVIPQGKQFNTFDAQSYLGNPLLCGLSINTSCDRSHYQEPDNGVEADESIVDMVSFYWSLAAAYVAILIGICSSLSFDSPWRRFWFYLVDAFIHKAKSLL
ncbi:hypothetical protein F2Q69_00051560, partial [Brassica cretica]